MKTATLGMYDAPWMHAANDALWAAVRARLPDTDAPAALDRSRALTDIWHDPGLLLGQTCGYPLMTALGDAVTVVGAPVYDLPGCDGPRHCSFIVVAESAPFTTLADLRGSRVGLNGRDSNSGMNLLRHAIAPLAKDGRFFGTVVNTGGHLLSMDSVRRGESDAAAIDCVTFGLAHRHRPDLTAGLRVLARTAPGPALPFITRGGASDNEVAVLRDALNAVLAEVAPGSPIDALRLRRVEPAVFDDYAILLRYEAEAVAAGYPALA